MPYSEWWVSRTDWSGRRLSGSCIDGPSLNQHLYGVVRKMRITPSCERLHRAMNIALEDELFRVIAKRRAKVT